eukprot:CAMPEP_0117608742 /NCGR_PEP_ID=MMETSP0784-20121206/80962_1 /TAXON_ID=39447 /ORGANISM="" /LENGTH=596 /DNA_ID=CAMNT_0005412019 /DNA_START=62 /DNA_END=1852 /DNA_ORIENTATION=+
MSMTAVRAASLALLAVLCSAEEGGEMPENAVLETESISIAATLIGAISFQMLLFYCLNHRDPDMRRASYETLSSTISIFCAVLLFTSINDVVETYLLKGQPKEIEVVVDMLHMLFWFVAMQASLAIISGAVEEFKIFAKIHHIFGGGSESESTIEANMKCFAVLLAHITGFASINAWSAVQHLDIFAQSPVASLLTVPISGLGMWGLQRVFDYMREKVSLADDGEMDEKEKIWDEETEESENDVMGLTLSFQLVQSIRFALCSELPTSTGKESKLVSGNHTADDVTSLLYGALGFMGLVVITHICRPKHGHHEIHGSETKKRFLDLLLTMTSMAFAWCAFYDTNWFFLWRFVDMRSNPMLLRVIVAIILSGTSFTAIWILDKLADLECTNDTFDAAARQMISTIGFLVGFAWEQCFDEATESLSEVMPMKHVSKLGLAIFCAAIIVPAWRWWILPLQIQEGWKELWEELFKHEQFHPVFGHIKGKAEMLDCTDLVQSVKSLRDSAEVERQTRESSPQHPPSGEAHCRDIEAPNHEHYQQLPGDEVEVARLRKKCSQLQSQNMELQKSFQQMSKSYHEHMDVMMSSMSRMKTNLGFD